MLDFSDKRILPSGYAAAVLAVVALIALAVVPMPASDAAHANSGSCGDDAIYVFADGTLTISGTGDMKDNMYQHWDIDNIHNIKKVVIEDGITSVGKYAFRNCINIESVSVAATVTSIGMGAFENCDSMRTIVLPDSVTTIGVDAFSSCNDLNVIVLPDSVTTVGSGAIYGCNNIYSISIPSSLADATMFNGYEVYDVDGTTHIGKPTPENLKGYQYKVEGKKLIRLAPDSPYSVYPITLKANDSGLGSVTASVILVGYGAAVAVDGSSLSATTSVVGSDDPVTYSVDAVPADGCSFVEWEVPSYSVSESMAVTAVFTQGLVFDGVVYEPCEDEDGKVRAVGYLGAPESVAIPDSFRIGDAEYVPVEIDYDAFSGCQTLTGISIGSGVVSLTPDSLGSPMLKSIEVSSENQEYSSVAGVLYDKDVSTLIKFPASKQRLLIPDTVTSIGPAAFMDAGVALKAAYESGPITYFRYVSIPGSVVFVGEDAFRGSTLEVLKMADGTADIGPMAFGGCDCLRYIVFAGTLENVDDSAFDGCVFYKPNGDSFAFSIEATKNHKFEGDNNQDLKMYVPSVGGSITYGDLVYRIDLNDNIKQLTVKRLANDKDPAELEIPRSIPYLGFDWSVAEIGSKAFYNNTTLEYVSTYAFTIGFKAFANCSNLATVHLPEGGAIEFGKYCFANCTSLTSIDGFARIVGDSAFSGCSSVCVSNSDLIPVELIGSHAFYKCSLTVAYLYASKIGYGAFTGNSLTEVGFSSSLSEIDPKSFFGYRFYDSDGNLLEITADCLASKHFTGENGDLRMAS
ncbi:MAG: leucine-rich repeat protein [Candidatus Methanomethylophilaceae archaeon]|nr:leucine-rich repeat protein [Candidatus Methanomethylophilaceae archaeon]